MATTFKYLKAANKAEHAEMLAQLEAENEFQQQEPHGSDENGENCPIHFRLERHGAWQLQAYTPSGTMMDSSYHETFVRCTRCRKVLTLYGDDEMYCIGCNQSGHLTS